MKTNVLRNFPKNGVFEVQVTNPPSRGSAWGKVTIYGGGPVGFKKLAEALIKELQERIDRCE